MKTLTPEERVALALDGTEQVLAENLHAETARIQSAYHRIDASGLCSLAVDYVAVNGRTVEGFIKIDELNRGPFTEDQISTLGRFAMDRPTQYA